MNLRLYQSQKNAIQSGCNYVTVMTSRFCVAKELQFPQRSLESDEEDEL